MSLGEGRCCAEEWDVMRSGNYEFATTNPDNLWVFNSGWSDGRHVSRFLTAVWWMVGESYFVYFVTKLKFWDGVKILLILALGYFVWVSFLIDFHKFAQFYIFRRSPKSGEEITQMTSFIAQNKSIHGNSERLKRKFYRNDLGHSGWKLWNWLCTRKSVGRWWKFRNFVTNIQLNCVEFVFLH